VTDTPLGELAFLRKLQRLLAEGDFVATYKFALLNALADLSLERAPAADGSLRLPVSAIAEKFIEYYWPQARPYRALDGAGVVLLQNAGRQAAVINALFAAQSAHPTLPVARAVRGAWLRQIANIGANRPLLGGSDLASFLFGSERASLDGFRAVLRDHQQGRCLYCARELRGAGCVDHFIAWSRYPVDLGHNLVLAHDGCNAAKRDFLAYPAHLERWQSSHMERASAAVSRRVAHSFNVRFRNKTPGNLQDGAGRSRAMSSPCGRGSL
jgi:hypothetical protein